MEILKIVVLVAGSFFGLIALVGVIGKTVGYFNRYKDVK